MWNFLTMFMFYRHNNNGSRLNIYLDKYHGGVEISRFYSHGKFSVSNEDDTRCDAESTIKAIIRTAYLVCGLWQFAARYDVMRTYFVGNQTRYHGWIRSKFLYKNVMFLFILNFYCRTFSLNFQAKLHCITHDSRSNRD